jgi:ligand-binding sensor domain-containing protein/signal transduction histidine kinase
LGASLTLRAERLPIRSYTTADGLPHDWVNRIVRDSRGFLWFCTFGGLSRFDGYTFANFGTAQGLPSAPVNDLLETRSGEYWVATDEGLVRFDPKGKPMFTLIVPEDPDRRARVITVLREGRDGTIWVGSNKHLYRLEKVGDGRVLRPVDVGLPTSFPGLREIVDVLEDAHGSLWITTPGGLYRRGPDGRADRYPEIVIGHDLSDLFEDHHGRVWVGSRSGGIARLSTDIGHDAPLVDLSFGEADGLPDPWVTRMLETSDGRFLIATANGFAELLAAQDDQGRRIRSYTMRNGLTHRHIADLSEDVAGNLWLSTTNAGVMKLAREGFTSYGEQDGIAAIGAILEDRAGTLCFRAYAVASALESLYTGLTLENLKRNPDRSHPWLGCFDGGRIAWFYPSAVASFGWVYDDVTLQGRHGDWWLGTGSGLYHFAPADRFAALETARPLAVYTTADGLAGNQIYRIFEDSREDVWISSVSEEANGLARWDRKTQRVRDLVNAAGLPSIHEEVPRSFGEDAAGNIWIGFRDAAARYSNGEFTSFNVRDGVPPGAIMNMFSDHSGGLWLVSTEGGIARIDRPSDARPAFVRYTTANGLSSNDVRAITEDRAGYLYVGSGNGLDRLDPATGRVKHFTAADGLVAGMFMAGYRDRAGVLWFGSTSGLTWMAPGSKGAAENPPVLITGVRVMGNPQVVSALGETQISLPDLAAQQNQLQIDFVALGFGPGEVLRYQYQLRGADADWSAFTEQRTVNYASLAPGRYTFTVRAMNADGGVSLQPASVTFTVLRPIWLRWWSLTLAAFAVASMIVAVYRYRVARVLELAAIRTRIATDLHDDIGADLTRIALLSEVARQTHDEAPVASIARIARESVSAMGDIVWAINPKRETMADLVRRMRQHADEVFTLRHIDLQFNATDAHVSARLGMDVRRDLLLVFKEAVNNAARHSRCSRVLIDLHREGESLVLSVADNGVGFDASRESEGQGLASLRRRAERLHGTLAVSSIAGTGTTVRLQVPHAFR